jgi:alginate O-acetyltransferase complex protein AlgI
MTFTSLTFVFFLGLVFISYWSLTNRFHQNALLLCVSYIFYGWWDYRFCILMFGTSILDYGIGLLIYRTAELRWRRFLLILNIACNLGVLGFFKYFNFFADNFQSLAASLGLQVHPVTLRILLPAGISFYTFQAMSYTIDIYRGKMVPTRHPIEYLAFISFFPHLVAGPIMRAAHLLPQFLRRRQFDYSRAVDGCRQILWGFFKKMVLADNLAVIVDKIYADPASMTGPQLAAATVCFAFQIYYDFSAYSDIAIGTAKLFGFDLMRNFAYPYFSQTMSEFWRRWHISLSTWFRDYVYISMGGGRVSRLRRACNVLVTFLLSGFWHGAAWNFALWGGLNGITLIPEQLQSTKAALKAVDTPGGERRLPTLVTLLRIFRTFALTCALWIFFRARSLQEALSIFRKIAVDAPHLSTYGSVNVVRGISPIGGKVFLMAAALICLEWWQREHPHPLVLSRWPGSARWIAYTGLFWAVIYWGTHSPVQFIYFQF